MRRMRHFSSVPVSSPETGSGPCLATPVEPARLAQNPARHPARGFTLVESMVGTVLFAMVMIGVYTGLVQAYHMQAVSRYRDNARAILRTYVDQFQRLSTTTEFSNVPYSRWLFVPTGGFSGDGLSTTGLCTDDIRAIPDPGPPGNLILTPPIEITLGSSNPAGQTASWSAWPRPALNRSAITESYALPAQLSREISYINPATGAVSNTLSIGDSGYMLQGVFRITFTYNRKLCTETLSVMRVVK